jgi:Icc-related predicted phosphoesterase
MAPKFTAVVCGHIHEARGISHMGKTVIVNPGPASIGNAAILERDEKGRAKVELL